MAELNESESTKDTKKTKKEKKLESHLLIVLHAISQLLRRKPVLL